MPNKFPAVCYRCGLPVAAGEGVVERITDAGKQRQKFGPQFSQELRLRWLTQHHECAQEWKGTAQHYKYNDLRKESTTCLK